MAKKKDKKGLLLLLLIPVGWIIYSRWKKRHKDVVVTPPTTETKKRPPATFTFGPEPAKKTYKKGVVINTGTKGLNLRQDMSTNSDILFTIPNGTNVYYLPTGNPSWVSVRVNPNTDQEKNGFASTKYLKLTNATEEI